MVDTNLKGPFLCARAIGPRMVSRGWGRVINLGFGPGRHRACPAARPMRRPKRGIINLTARSGARMGRNRRDRERNLSRRVCYRDEPLVLDDPVKYKEFVAQIPMGRWGELEELTGAVVFLASEASSYVTGVPLFVDGGWIARQLSFSD